MQEQEWLTPREVATMLHIKEPTLRSWLRKGKVEAFHVNFTWRIHRDVVKALTKKAG
jgi:excisionase family DNA binding protein